MPMWRASRATPTPGTNSLTPTARAATSTMRSRATRRCCGSIPSTATLLGVPHVAMFDHLTLFSLIGLAGVLELVGGALIVLGLFARPAAFILSGEMAVAYFMAHASHGNVLLPTLNEGEAAVLYCFVFLFLSVAGAGAWSFDSIRKSKPVVGRPAPVLGEEL